MSHTVRFALGLALMAAGVAAVGWSIYELTQIGTCASGGPYVSRRECPSETPWYIGGIFVGVVVFLIGAWVFATRGRSATKPGLPEPDSIRANPQPFGVTRQTTNRP